MEDKGMRSNHLYEVLELDPNVENTVSDIRRSYYRLAKLHHPDKGGDPSKFVKIRLAYEVLTEKELRKDQENGFDYSEEWWNNLTQRQKWIGMLYPNGVKDFLNDIRSPYNVILRVVKQIPLDIVWEKDVNLTVRLSKEAVGRIISVTYPVKRHIITNNIVSFIEELSKETIRLSIDIDYLSEDVVIVNGGNDVVQGNKIVRGDLILDVNIT